MADFKKVFKVAGEAPAESQQPGGVMARIKQDVESNPVLLYMKGDRDYPQCGFSAAVVEVLDELGVAYETRNILADETLRQAVKVYSNWPTYPQLYVNGELVGGCDIVMEMYQNGELAPLLEKAKA